DIMTKNIVAARASTTAREIGTKLLIGNFNGIPVVDNNIKLVGVDDNLNMLSKQLRRWSHGYLQNIRLHWKKMKKIPVLREQVIAALCDAFLGSIVLIVVLPLNLILYHDPLTILYALLADVSFISIPPIVKGYKMKMVQKVLSSLPFFLLIRLVNMYFFYNAFISEFLLNKSLTKYEKGH
ncbi:MAG: CBS domain-containing protein, partial [Candidatus Nitrosopolaris sp.]